eukprot:TRINITY_DN6148_c0_g1_i10.p2 TRINITY_DN6148_c0_g1~~TRINITY_DN6148_c0_g1_i10.p2  ORF type:complete len:238 (+),score=51.85 TRINITY_DN6148_c0_g1_i10:463-1176(+)
MFGAMSLQLGAAAEERREGDRSRSTGRNVTAGRRARNGPGGERQQREETSDEVRRLVGLIGRLSLSTASKTDVVMGAVTDVVILTEETVSIKIEGKSLALNAAVNDAMKPYTEQAKKLAQSKKQKAGPPHVRVWDTMLTFMERHAEESSEDDNDSQRRSSSSAGKDASGSSGQRSEDCKGAEELSEGFHARRDHGDGCRGNENGEASVAPGHKVHAGQVQRRSTTGQSTTERTTEED